MKKIYALFMTLCLIISATAGPLVGTAKKSYPLYQPEVVKAELALDAMQKAPAATQGLQYDAEAGELIRYYNERDQVAITTDYVAEYGELYVDIRAIDNSDQLSLLLFVEDTVEGAIIPEGTYPLAKTGAAGTAYASEGYTAQGVVPCAYYPLVMQNGQLYLSTPMYFMQSGNIVVEHVNGNPKITINAVNSNNVPMTIVFEVGGKSEKVEVKAPLQYDATEADGALDYTYGEDATVTATDKSWYGTFDVEDATSMLALLFVYPEGETADAEITIPVGTYTISDSQEAGTVLASSGVSNTGGVGYSFFAKTNEQGQLVPPLYFPISGTVEVTKVDGKIKVEVDGLNSNNVPVHVVYDATPAEPEIEWIPMDLEITNLTTEVMEVEGAKYLLLQGRDDMNDADVMLFLNNYADVDDDYVVNAESSYMTFGGIELTVLEGVMTQTSETDKGTIYQGTVRTYAAEEEMYVEFALTMYAAAPTVLELTDAIVAVNEDLGTLTFNVPTEDGNGYYVELSGYTAPGVHEGPQICLLETPEAVAFANYVETSVADGVITLTGEFTSFMGGKYNLTISGQLPGAEEPEVGGNEPTYTENNLNPYAFGLESELSADKATLTVIYRLNNSNATDVNVLIYNGEEVAATIPATNFIGKNIIEVPTANLPAGVELKWAVEVNGTSVEAPTQETKMYNMYCPHGLAIDTDPESEYFGRILVADAMNVVKDKAGYLGSGIGAGLHAFNPSFTTDSTVYTGGNDFTRILTDNGYQPWRVKISEDGRIFVSSLDLNGVVVWEVSKDLQTWTPVIAGTNDATDYNIYDAEGNFIAGPNCSMDVIGKGEDLKLLLYSTNNKGIAFNQSGYRLDEYALGTATTWTGTPKNILEGGKFGVVHTNVEFIYDGEGGYWFGGSRAGNAGQPNLVHINAAGEQDYYTEDASLYGGDGVLVHNGMLFKGKARTSGTVGNFGVWTIGKDADGKVTLTEKWAVVADGIGRNLNEFAVDYAENLYVVGNSGEKIIAYALPYSGKVETPAAAKYAFQIEGSDTPDQGLTLTATGLETQLESDGSYTLQGNAVVNGDESNLMDFMLCVYPTDGYTDAFLNGWSVMIFGAPTPGAFVENEDGTFTYTAKIEDTFGDGTVYNINMSGTIKKTEGPEYMELDDQITNMTIDLENMVIYGGPSTNFEIEVVLGLGEDNFDGSFTLSDESSVVIKGIDAEFVEGYVYDIDINAPSAVAVVKVNWDDMYYEFTLTMSAAPAEATVVVVENATVEIEKYLLFGDTYDYALKMSGEWINPEDGLTYPVLVEVPVYYPEATEPYEMLSTVTVGGWGDNDPWLGFGEGTLTVTTVDGVVTATGRVENPMAGVVIDITISGTIIATSLEDATVTVKPVKMIQNGQLIIKKGDVQYNAQGATLK